MVAQGGVLSNNKGINRKGGGLTAPALTEKDIRDIALAAKLEADFLGIQYMYKAGYDPQALTAFFEKIKSLERTKESKVVKAFRTHPQTPERIEKTQAEINTLLPPQLQYKVDTSEFEDTKSRLESLENHGRLRFENATRPTLRKREPMDVGPN